MEKKPTETRSRPLIEVMSSSLSMNQAPGEVLEEDEEIDFNWDQTLPEDEVKKKKRNQFFFKKKFFQLSLLLIF